MFLVRENNAPIPPTPAESGSTPPAPRQIARYASIDLIRGVALFMNVFVHIFTDVFNLSPITDNLFGLPISVLLLFIAIGYFGSFGSWFIMISGTGNTISMQKGLEGGKSVGAVASRQIVSGIILVIFSFLVEGVFQFYGYFGTILGWNGHAYDITRAVWHAYTMTPVTCLAVSMIITGVVHYFLSLNEGYKKYLRNILVYAILAVVVVIVSQPVWDFCKAVGPAGFPNAHIGEGYPGDYKVYMPPPDASFLDLITHFFLAISAGSNHPIFPYLAMMFVGNIIGILLVKEKNEKNPNPHVPRYGMLAGVVVFLVGVAMIPILGVDFASFLPVDAVGDITLIHDGRDAFWVPWWCFLMAGEIFLIFLVVRVVEYRGAGSAVAKRTTFLRRFGMPAFSVYAWHRFWAIPAIVLISWLAGQPSWESGSITGVSFNWALTIITVVAVWVSIHFLLKAWEKIGYIGGIEWMMGTVAAALGKNFRKTKGTTKEHAKWWEYGKMAVQPLFYDALWLDIISRDETYLAERRDSQLAKKLGILGFVVGIFAIIGLKIALRARKEEGESDLNRKARLYCLVGIIIFAILITVTSIVGLGTLGISL